MGEYETMMAELQQGEEEEEAAFTHFTRLPPHLFHQMKTRVAPLLHTSIREPLEPGLRLAITLRYLATGESYHSLSYSFRLSHNTISKVVLDTCQAIAKAYEDKVMDCPSTPDEWRRVAHGFQTRWNCLHTCGAVGGTHVAIRCPPKEGSMYFNYKKFHSSILLAVVDANYNFLYVAVGTPGSVSDGGIWSETSLGQALEEGRAGFPDPEPLPGEDNPDIPYALVGDDAFPLRSWMMKPYLHRQISGEQRIFNNRLSRARRVVENAFGILASRFRCLLTTMEQEPENVQTIVYAACVLHNLIRTKSALAAAMAEGDTVDTQTGNITPGSWRAGGQAAPMVGLERLPGNTSNKRAKMQREHLCAYYNSELGSVPWQNDVC